MRQSYLTLCYFFLSISSVFAQSQASDSHYPATRNAFHNTAMQAYIYHEVGTYITQSYDYQYVLRNFYNTNYLFHEPISWTKKVTRIVDISDREEDFKEQLEFYHKILQVTLFKDTLFEYPYSEQERDSLRDSIGISSTQIAIRENWYFNPEIKGFKSAKVAIGLMSKKGKVLAWYAYPDFRIFLLQAAMPFGKDPNFDAYLRRGLYPTISLKTTGTLCADNYAEGGYGREYDALFEMSEFTNRVRYWEQLSKKERKSAVPKGVTYTVDNKGLLNGLATWPGISQKGICTQQFEGGLANGDFLMKDGNQVVLSGKFAYGNREGMFESYFPSGGIETRYFFKYGLQDSIQQVNFKTGKPRLIYNMTQGEPNGDYKSFLEDGSVREAGQFDMGYITGEWSYHIPMIHYFCYYMNETTFEWTVKDYIQPTAFEDCFMDLEMYLEKKTVKGCPGGFCIIAYLKDEIR